VSSEPFARFVCAVLSHFGNGLLVRGIFLIAMRRPLAGLAASFVAIAHWVAH
jgi:hypothetical protein